MHHSLPSLSRRASSGVRSAIRCVVAVPLLGVAALLSACAATATKDGQKDAWLYVPKGTCEKIVGASLKSGK